MGDTQSSHSETEIVKDVVWRVHAKVIYKDGSTDTIDYTDQYEANGFKKFIDYDYEDWAVGVDGSGELYLYADGPPNPTEINTDSIEKIRSIWTEELYIVAEVPVTRSSSRFLGTENIEVGDPQCAYWEQVEWEARNE